MTDSFNTKTELAVGDNRFEIRSLAALASEYDLSRLPFSLKILLENLLRHEDGETVTRKHIDALARWDPKAEPSVEIAFTPSRVLLQDFTGVPAVVDLAVMRDAMRELGGDPDRINPLAPADLVIDHSLTVDHFSETNAGDLNAALEFNRNKERYGFLRWGQHAFSNFRVVPPSTGIVHQVNLEYLAQVTFAREIDGRMMAYPDTVVGTDSHTTMVNGLGVLGWGVGGIEAEAAMLGQPISMLIPQVVGFRLIGELPEGATATDLVLRVVEMLRAHGVVGKFVEFFGDGLDTLTIADQSTIANMAPEYGATCGIFPIDEETIEYMRLSGRPDEQIALTEAYSKHQGLYRMSGQAEAQYTHILELRLEEVVPSIAGPKRPQDRIALTESADVIGDAIREERAGNADAGTATAQIGGEQVQITDGDIVIAAITSCTNTSNPGVIMGAGLLAQKAVEKGLKVKPWVKTSLAPGSQVVTGYLEKAGLLTPLQSLGFNVVGYGCTTCIGNSGPLPPVVSKAITDGDVIACSVLSGNRNFEGRVHQEVRMNFLASPPLVVAYALAGTTGIDFAKDAIGEDSGGKPVFLKDIWPSLKEIRDAISATITRELFQAKYADVFTGDSRWAGMDTPTANLYGWTDDSTYIQKAPYFDGMTREIPGVPVIRGARVLARLGDSITTDHISPAGAIAPNSPAAAYLGEHGVSRADFNSYGSRRGNHEVMMRGTFANIRLRNELAPGTEGGFTRHFPDGEVLPIFEAALKYRDAGVPTIILGGKEYGTGSSRDWAAKGPKLLGVEAVIVESFERIHRSNLIGMGIVPLTFKEGESRNTLGLSGEELYDIEGLDKGVETVTVVAKAADGKETRFQADVRIDTPKEWDYYTNGGILHYVIRQLLV